MSPAKVLREFAANLRSRQWERTVKKNGWVHAQYRYWQQQSGNKEIATNACPYLRRVCYAQLYRLKNLAIAGPTIMGHRVPVLPSLLLVGVIAGVSWLFAGSVLGVAIITGLAFYALAGGALAVHFAESIIDEIAERSPSERKIGKFSRWVNRNGDEGEAAWLLVLLPAVLCYVAIAAALLAVVAVLYAILGTIKHLFTDEGLDLPMRLARLLNKHPRRIPWLRPWAVLGLPLLTWTITVSEPVRVILIVVTICLTFAVGITFLSEVFKERVLEPRSIRRGEAEYEARRAYEKREQARLQKLFAEPLFLAWLAGDSYWADYFRSDNWWVMRDFYPLSDHINTNEDRQALSTRIMAEISLSDLRAVEWAFVWEYLGRPISTEAEPSKLVQPKHGWLVGKVILPIGHGVWWLVDGFWEGVKLFWGVVAAGKLAAICPRITIVDDDGTPIADKPTVAA